MNTILNKQEGKSKRLNAIISNAPSIILVMSPDYKILELTAAAERLFGVESEEGRGKDHLELAFPDEVRLAITTGGKKVLEGIPTREFETQVMAPDRNIRTFCWKIDKLVDTPGRGGNIVVSGTDITERKQVEDSLRESETWFRLLVEQAGDAFFIIDYAGKILDVNRQACLSLGYTSEELLSMTILEVDTEVEKMKHKTRFWTSLEPGQQITIEGMHRRKNGSTFPTEVRLGRLDLGEKRLLLALARDITERKQKEEKLDRAFEEIKELKDKLEEENIYLRKEIELRYRHEKIVGESDAIKRVLSQAEKVANADTCILILGETGTGKELLAYAIHNISNRKGHAMVTVNCAALPATLIESELFGREKGAFTGALRRQIGRFEAAHGSTIFLDEIGDLPIELQAKLLRVVSVDVRVISSTNRNLAEMVRKQKFREDLYYRLNVFPITLPPLRERQEDIPILVWSIVKEFAKSMGKPITKIQKKTMQSLTQYAWPGNIRELKNVIERAMIMSSGSTLEIEYIVDKDAPTDMSMSLEEIEKKHILKVLQSTNWRVSGEKGAAKILKLKSTTLEARMKKMDIQRQI